MRLKSIRLSGFKSFADPITVEFPGRFSSIVGPNGCGKSNIIDAVRWVMGESSARTMRSESMADVIFNGAGGRRPLGQASVELIFDNRQGKLGGPYAAYDEISIRRQVDREGESKYYLNGTRCRRRDITDILHGTGLGSRSYAIIEQGVVSRLVEAKPEELRAYLEEAAGTSLYRERRRETENRMKHTRENLNRVEDLRSELENHLRTLKRQASEAERYGRYQDQEQSLKGEIIALRQRALAEQMQKTRKEVSKADGRVEEVLARLRKVDTKNEALRLQHTERNDTFNQVQARYYELGGEVARLEESISSRQVRDEEITAERSAALARRQAVEEEQRHDRKILADGQARLATLEPELAAARDAEQQAAEGLRQEEQAQQEFHAQWDSGSAAVAEAQGRLRRLEAHAEALAGEDTRLAAQQKELEEEQKNLANMPALPAEDPEEAAARQRRDALETQVRECDVAVDAGRRRQREASEARHRCRSALAERKGQRAALELQLKQAADGLPSTWEQHLSRHKARPLVELLQIESGWELAVEQVLGQRLGALCVQDLEALLSGLPAASLPKGLDFVAAGRSFDAASAELLAARVSGPAGLESLLGQVYAAKDRPAALGRRGQLKAGESVISKDGLWLGPGWARLAGTEEGALRVQQAAEVLDGEITGAEAALQGAEAEYAGTEQALAEMEAERERCRQELMEVAVRSAELTVRGDQVRERAARRTSLEQQLAANAARREEIAREVHELQEQQRGEEKQVKETGATQDVLRGQRDAMLSRIDQLRQGRGEKSKAAQEKALEMESLRTRADQVRKGLERLERELAHGAKQDEELEKNAASNLSPLAGLQGQLKDALKSRAALEKELGQAREALTAVEEKQRQAGQQRAEIEAEVTERRNELEQCRVRQGALAAEFEGFSSQFQELGLNAEEIQKALPEDAEEDAWQHKLDLLGARIQRLGAVNLAAQEEYQQESERKSKLDEQQAELEKALNMLEEAIQRIDRESRRRFRDTFDQVNQGLGEMFPRLFGGGQASLEMLGQDLLSTGIVMTARPPGKRNVRIEQLSGGEKSLSAIALVFSLFQLNPSPFCMLDEVDAPLDDSNVARFVELIREFSERVQIICVTHNKLTMEAASQLLGITMGEPGISQLVSVDIDEAGRMVDSGSADKQSAAGAG